MGKIRSVAREATKAITTKAIMATACAAKAITTKAIMAIAVLLSVAATSCNGDTGTDGNGTGDNDTGLATGEFTEMSFELTAPGEFAPAPGSGSRAMTPKQQNAIYKVLVLQFQNNVRNNMMVHQTYGTVSDGSGDSGSAPSVRAVLRSSQVTDDLFDIVVIANPGTMTAEEFLGKTKAEVQAGLTFATEPYRKDDIWKTSGIPMWGEATGQLIKPTANSMKITLLRSLATIEIGLGKYDQMSNTWGGLSNFELAYLGVMNVNDRGAAIPIATTVDQGAITVTAPSVPAGTKTVAGNPFGSIVYTNDISEGKQCTSSIFIGEINKTDRTDPYQRLNFIIGGRYGGGSQPVTYYRVDMIPGTDGATGGNAETQIDILRNHVYRLSITAVSGPGAANDTDAYYNGPSSQIRVELTPWNAGDMGDIVFNAQGYIATDASEVLICSRPDGVREYEIATVRIKSPRPAQVKGSFGPSFDLPTDGSPYTIKAALPQGVDTYHTFTITAGELSKVILAGVYHPIDFNGGVESMHDVESLSFVKPMTWVYVSEEDKPSIPEKLRNYEGISNWDPNEPLYIYFDDCRNTSDEIRTTTAIVRTKRSTRLRVLFEQKKY